jgi:regulator of replication initiation timing
MSETQIHIERIQQKMQVLLRQWQTLRKENERLLRENAQLKLQETSYLDTIGQLNRQVEVLKVTSVGLGEADKKAIEKKINAYVREIDKCIALLTE